MANNTPASEPDFDNMTDDEIIAFFDEMQAIEDHKWRIDV